jgi:hypothetical protein
MPQDDTGEKPWTLRLRRPRESEPRIRRQATRRALPPAALRRVRIVEGVERLERAEREQGARQ